MKLSIIIPCWNAEPYIFELLNALEKQITDECEVILVDDGSTKPLVTSYSWCKVYRKENGGVSTARNMGLDLSTGDYIQFIDADDLVPDYFIQKLLEAAKGDPDIIEYSWRTLDGSIVRMVNGRQKNPSACTRCFSRTLIGDIRFNVRKDSTEDEDFSRKVGYLWRDDLKIATIDDFMYFYRTSNRDSKVKRFKRGLMNTKRIVYYYPKVTADMTYLVDEIKKDDEQNEVILITNRCDIPELKYYCQITDKKGLWGHYQKGEPLKSFIKMDIPIKTQVIIYVEYANIIGGIPTFIYNFCQVMKEYYDIIFLYDNLDPMQTNRIKKTVRVMKNTGQALACDTLILNRLTDKRPANVYCKKIVQMCHCCKLGMPLPKDNDYLVNVSQASKDSWGAASKHGIVINNLPYKEGDDAIFLISAMRGGAKDKGKNDDRIRILADMIEKSGIDYLWFNFSDVPMEGMPKRFINQEARVNIQPYIRRADYLVLLSDQEACSLSILEALTNNTAILATPFESLFEEGFIDGENGYLIPFDMKFDINKIRRIPQFNYEFDTQKRIDQWREILGYTTPKKDYIPDDTIITDAIDVKARKLYYDEQLGRNVFKREIISVRPKRAKFLLENGCIYPYTE